MTFSFEIDTLLGDNEVTLVGEFDDDGDIYLEDVRLGDESIYELLAKAIQVSGGFWDDFEQTLISVAADEHARLRAKHAEEVAEHNRDIRDDR